MAETYCRNCGVELRRFFGRWRHVTQIGPVACPEPEPEEEPDKRSLRTRWRESAMWRDGVIACVVLIVGIGATFADGFRQGDGGLVGFAVYMVPAAAFFIWMTWKIRYWSRNQQ